MVELLTFSLSTCLKKKGSLSLSISTKMVNVNESMNVMDVIKTESVKVPNYVLVGGLTGGEIDNEVIEYLGSFGSIERTIKVTSIEAQFKDAVIVEFQSGEPVLFLQSTLPCKRPTSNPDVTDHIQCLSDLYPADKG